MANAFTNTTGGGFVPKAPKSTTGGDARLPKHVAINEIAYTFTMLALTAKQPGITARAIHNESDVLRNAYERPNAIGDVAGAGRKGHNIGLRKDGKSGYVCSRQNVQRALQAMDQPTLDKLLAKLSFDVDALVKSLNDFPADTDDVADANPQA